jgi:uncharacterized integral membrane protein (TIGR00697 family)
VFRRNKLDLLIALYIFCICAAELMGAKTFPLFTIGSLPIRPTVAIFLLPLVFTINDIITEVYGKERTRSIIRSGLIVIALIFIFSVFAVSLPPSSLFEGTEPAYDMVFGISARVSAASLIAFAIAEFMDVVVYVNIRKRLGSERLWLRNNISNFISQFIDTAIFMTLAFYAFDQSPTANVTLLVGRILPYWLLKCFMSVIETPFVYLGVRWLRNDPALPPELRDTDVPQTSESVAIPRVSGAAP